MSETEGKKSEKTPPPENDVERGPPTADVTEAIGGGGKFGLLLRKWRIQNVYEKGSLILRALAFIFSLFSFIIMDFNDHGPGKQVRDYEEYKYLMAIAMISAFYTGFQCYRHFLQLNCGKDYFTPKTSAYIDFVGDQLMAYLLLSSASSAIPMTNRIREGADNIFSDSCAAAITMSLLAFFSFASSSIIAGYKFSTQSF